MTIGYSNPSWHTDIKLQRKDGKMTLEQIKTMSAAKVAKHLAEYQKWRRGEPPYAYGCDNHPFTPKELGDIINRAIELLKEIK